VRTRRESRDRQTREGGPQATPRGTLLPPWAHTAPPGPGGAARSDGPPRHGRDVSAPGVGAAQFQVTGTTYARLASEVECFQEASKQRQVHEQWEQRQLAETRAYWTGEREGLQNQVQAASELADETARRFLRREEVHAPGRRPRLAPRVQSGAGRRQRQRAAGCGPGRPRLAGCARQVPTQHGEGGGGAARCSHTRLDDFGQRSRPCCCASWPDSNQRHRAPKHAQRLRKHEVKSWEGMKITRKCRIQRHRGEAWFVVPFRGVVGEPLGKPDGCASIASAEPDPHQSRAGDRGRTRSGARASVDDEMKTGATIGARCVVCCTLPGERGEAS
jgi:hypothetical protein